ncbi:MULTISPECIES: hypothetical protein [Nocardiopsis]|uniref:Uncharacterized protein n=1 Tax=Nocardiopsis sinuspersici TaxID=501010 RepID=A0A1V3C1K7_9ACTN|nr:MULTISPECIES: hypothetical protein [Nocardiopsis]NYH50720.1 hypothetical protein [Nocardiopsis sinuspersici]OOC54573.1 hypothetical protein NOSIN_12750 [Nocardiopsis sinuspersici]
MRTTAKLMMTALFTAGLLGMGVGTASASGGGDYEACVDQQNALGLINLDLNLLAQCIATGDN